MLEQVLPILDRVKQILESKGGPHHSSLVLAELSESIEGEMWIITLFCNIPGEEAYYETRVSKRDSKVIDFRRLESQG